MRLIATLALLALGTAALGAQAPDAEQVKKGREVFDRMKCSLCHKVGDKGGTLGPSLDGVALRRDAAAMRRILEHPDKELTDPGNKVKMPTFPFKDGEIDALIAFLQTLKTPAKG